MLATMSPPFFLFPCVSLLSVALSARNHSRKEWRKRKQRRGTGFPSGLSNPKSSYHFRHVPGAMLQCTSICSIVEGHVDRRERIEGSVREAGEDDYNRAAGLKAGPRSISLATGRCTTSGVYCDSD